MGRGGLLTPLSFPGSATRYMVSKSQKNGGRSQSSSRTTSLLVRSVLGSPLRKYSTRIWLDRPGRARKTTSNPVGT